MRISDWSSDVCSSDLIANGIGGADNPFLRSGIARPGRSRARPGSDYASADSERGDLRHAFLARGRGRPPLSTQFCRCDGDRRSEEHTSELQSLMRISYAVFCLKKTKKKEDND